MNPSQKSLVPFNFYGDEIEVVKDNDTLWISVRRVCGALGIHFEPQHRKLSQTPWARMINMIIPDARGRNQNAFLVDLDTLLMWLATISSNKVAEHIRPKLVTYQREAKKALADHFLPKSTAMQSEREIEHLANTRKHASFYLGHLRKLGIISEDYLMRYVGHSVAVIDGTLPPPGPRLIDVSSYLESKGVDKRTIRRYGSKFGKIVKKLFVQETGAEPRKVHRLINGSERLVNSYTENHFPLFDKAYGLMFGQPWERVLMENSK